MPDEWTPEPGGQPAGQRGADWPAYDRATLGREPRQLFPKSMAAVEAAGVA